MKQSNGLGHIKTLILIIIITTFVASGVYYVRMQYNRAKIKTIKTNMSMIELKAKEYLNKQKSEGEEDTSYIGTCISEISEKEEIKKLIDDEIIKEDEIEDYYLLTDEDLEELKCIDIYNEEDSFYLINYDSFETIITKGCRFNDNKTIYKYSDIKSEDEKNES